MITHDLPLSARCQDRAGVNLHAHAQTSSPQQRDGDRRATGRHASGKADMSSVAAQRRAGDRASPPGRGGGGRQAPPPPTTPKMRRAQPSLFMGPQSTMALAASATVEESVLCYKARPCWLDAWRGASAGNAKRRWPRRGMAWRWVGASRLFCFSSPDTRRTSHGEASEMWRRRGRAPRRPSSRDSRQAGRPADNINEGQPIFASRKRTLAARDRHAARPLGPIAGSSGWARLARARGAEIAIGAGRAPCPPPLLTATWAAILWGVARGAPLGCASRA